MCTKENYKRNKTSKAHSILFKEYQNKSKKNEHLQKQLY